MKRSSRTRPAARGGGEAARTPRDGAGTGGGRARAFWKGSISFGLVEIPVTLRPAIKANELGFSLLDRRDFSPVGYRHYNKSTGREVEWSQIVRGYEYEPDEYVVLSDEELKQANARATQTVEILEFVDRDEIPPMFFDTPYFVEPLKQGSKAYALLRDALERTGKVGIANVVLRTRQHLAALLVRDQVLMLDLLRYPDELRAPGDLALPSGRAGSTPSAQEVSMAERLIEGMSGAWTPEKYKDDYREDVLALVRKKVKSGQTHEIVEPAKSREPAPRREVMDLMPLLKQSLDSKGGKRAPKRAPRTGGRSRSRERGGRRSA
jgi:DNA end-binding protein Ku